MVNAPILLSTNHLDLVHMLTAKTLGKDLKSTVRKRRSHIMLAAASAIAFGALKAGIPHGALRSVLVLGSASIEAMDDGQWLRYVPAMLGRDDFEIKVTFCGATEEKITRTPVANTLKPMNKINVKFLSITDISTLLKDNPKAFDAVFWADAPLDSKGAILSSGLFNLILNLDIPLIMGSYTGATAAVSNAILMCENANVLVPPFVNPFALQTRESEFWCGTLSVIKGVSPDKELNVEVLAREIPEALKTAHNLIARGKRQAQKVGDVVSDANHKRAGFRYVVDGWYLTPCGTELHHPESLRVMPFPQYLPSTPQSDAAVSRLAWVAKVDDYIQAATLDKVC